MPSARLEARYCCKDRPSYLACKVLRTQLEVNLLCMLREELHVKDTGSIVFGGLSNPLVH